MNRAEYMREWSQRPRVKARRLQQQRERRQRPEIKVQQHEHYQQMKVKAYQRIGGARCVLCGCEEPIFLTVDHADGNGHLHRQQMCGRRAGNGHMPEWILKATNTELAKWHLRVLCGSCQKATQHSNDAEVRAAAKREHKRIRSTK
ncbi:MAG: hypothetical protein WC052_04815 [Patescibacteria group bacterium]|jgi:hypothetical protein